MTLSDCAIFVQDASLVLNGTTIFHDVQLQVPWGSIWGINGRNGAGKTMLLRCIEGFIPLTRGKIMVAGRYVRKECNFAPETGFVIEPSGFFAQYSGRKNLLYLSEISQGTTPDQIDEIMLRVGLDPKDKRTVGKYSKGMLQRLSIAQALIENPKVLLLDEPMNGLDSDGVQMLRTLLLNFADAGGAVLMASHYREDFENLCSGIYEMKQGQ